MDKPKELYPADLLKRSVSPGNYGTMDNPDGFARHTGPCGDTMEFFLRIRDNKVAQATFHTDGCASSVVCGDMAAEMAAGKRVPQAFGISQEKILKALGGLPEDEQHCALLAATTMRLALKDYLANKREPWKKAYRV